MRHFVLLLASLLFSASLTAQVIETKEMTEVMSHVDKDTLLIFDLDNTIIMPVQMIGGEEWYEYVVEKMVKEAVQDGETKEAATPKAIQRALGDWVAIQRVTASQAVERNGSQLISHAQARGVKTLALTARPTDLVEATEKSLYSIGVDFKKGLFSTDAFDIKLQGLSRYENGILFVGVENTKGDVLNKYFEKVGRLPKKIVFVDNKEKHVVAVEKALAPSKIPYLGCRHGASDEKIRAFRPEIAEVQWRWFRHILSDRAAMRLLED